MPLKTEHQIEALKLGKKTTDKLTQILTTGRIRRNEEMAGDVHDQLFHQFTNVWGAAQATAQKWIASGCMTLEDVASRSDLTEIQRVGVQYYDDFQQRIPCAEAIKIFKNVRNCVWRSLAQIMHSTVRRIQSEVRDMHL